MNSPTHHLSDKIHANTDGHESLRFKPGITVAGIIEREGKFLMVEEETAQGLRLNNPAGHLEPAESLIEACTREVLEETAHGFRPTELLGIYLSHYPNYPNGPADAALPLSAQKHYLRFAFVGELGAWDSARALDAGIVRTLWLTADEIRAAAPRLRSPIVLRCIEDYLRPTPRSALSILQMAAM